MHWVTASGWEDIAMAPGQDVFVQEFADWCPYCVMMHYFTNNLAWVMEPVDHVT
jgi:hypothetical protein